MKTIRIDENVTTRTIEYDESRKADVEEEVEEVVTKHGYISPETEELKDDKENYWPNLYVYLLYLACLGTSAAMLPPTARFATVLTGGVIVVFLVAFSVFGVLPLMYMEMFIGLYVKRTNSDIYRMAPIFFGIGIVIFMLNGAYIVTQTIEDSTSLVSILGRITQEGKSITSCPNGTDKVCYNYKTRGALADDNCRYGYYSLVCEKSGEIRYPCEYNYWNTFKNEDTTAYFPAWSLLGAASVVWILIFYVTTRSMSICAKLFAVFFGLKMLIYTIMYALAYPRGGIRKRVAMHFNRLNVFEVIFLGIFAVRRSGIIIPIGYMTNSAYVEHSQYLTLEGLAVVVFGLLFTIFDLLVIQAIMGALAVAIGVQSNPGCLVMPYRGIYLALIPEFLNCMNLTMEFIYPYYISYLGLQLMQISIQMKIMLLNFYAYFPKLKRHDSYVRLVLCGICMVFSATTVSRAVHINFLPNFHGIFLTVATVLCLAVQMTMISYVYGVRRLCDDIHFITGHRPMYFWKIAWSIIPVLLWAAFAMIITRQVSTTIEKDGFYDRNTTLELYILVISLFILISGSFGYILHTMGTEHMLLNLIRPQFYWGPKKREDRIKRKHFTPTTAIRSQPPRIRSSKIEDKPERVRSKEETGTSDEETHPGQETESEEALHNLANGRIFSDSKFFTSIGISLDNASLLNVRPDSRRTYTSQPQLNVI